jgi:ADP-heptose:LPS heptosyltransferase
MAESEQALVDRLTVTDYVVIHPFAGRPDRATMPEEGYIPIIDRLIDKGLIVIVIGGGKDEMFTYAAKGLVNLVNKASVRVAVNLVLGCKGFIGSHSSMILPAWYKNVKTVCIVPPYHDGGQPWNEFWDSNNPTVWGAHKEFTKTIMIDVGGKVDPGEVVDWIV